MMNDYGGLHLNALQQVVHRYGSLIFGLAIKHVQAGHLYGTYNQQCRPLCVNGHRTTDMVQPRYEEYSRSSNMDPALQIT